MTGTEGRASLPAPRECQVVGSRYGDPLPTVTHAVRYFQYGTSGATPATVSSWRLAADVHALQLL